MFFLSIKRRISMGLYPYALNGIGDNKSDVFFIISPCGSILEPGSHHIQPRFIIEYS